MNMKMKRSCTDFFPVASSPYSPATCLPSVTTNNPDCLTPEEEPCHNHSHLFKESWPLHNETTGRHLSLSPHKTNHMLFSSTAELK